MIGKTGWLCCMAAILGLVVVSSRAAPLFEDDFSGDLSKWTVVSSQTADDKIEIVAGEVHFYRKATAPTYQANSLTTKTSFQETHTLELDFKRATGESDSYGFTLRYGLNGNTDTSYDVVWRGSLGKMFLWSLYQGSWAMRADIAAPSELSLDQWYHLVIENAATSTTVSIYEGVNLVDSKTFNHDPINTDRVIKLENTAGPETGYIAGVYVDNVQVVPEPATMGLLLLGIPMALRRRKRQG